MQDKENLVEWRERLLGLLSEESGGEEADGVVTGQMGDELVEVLSFRLGQETFGFDIRSVSEILRPRPITTLPRSPEFILGVISLRGLIIPVADTALRLGLTRFDSSKNHRIIVVNDGEELMGFAVDQVTGVVRFAKGDLESTDYAASVDPAFLLGIGYDAKRQLVALLGTEKLCDFTVEAK